MRPFVGSTASGAGLRLARKDLQLCLAETDHRRGGILSYVRFKNARFASVSWQRSGPIEVLD